jgi:uncharacterized 2Fe-2S/4Fe-4S cluster protein (DUF4445 family)
MPEVTVIYGQKVKTVDVPNNSLLGDAIALTGLPLEQPCAGRGTCGKCKVIVESGVSPPDEIEASHLSPGELALDQRLACRARIEGDARVVLSPIVVYSNKIFHASSSYKRNNSPLGLAVDLGSTTVAAFLTMLDTGEVCASGGGLNQQSVYGADVISRLQAARSDPAHAARLQRLAVASINHAVDSLNLSRRVRQRIERVTIVGNVAMHHLLTGLPVDTLAEKPFQPVQKTAITSVNGMMGGIFESSTQIWLPPLIGGFVGSDALACLAYFGFDQSDFPIAAVDLGTNGEVMVTDGKRILTASTAAGPAFEGVFISCGTRAVDGAVTGVRLSGENIELDTIADQAPVGLTGSGLLSLVNVLRKVGVIEPSGKLADHPPLFADRLAERKFIFSPESNLSLTQWDIRELQKAKGAIRAAIDTLLDMLELKPEDLKRLILTGSFGGQIQIDSALELGLIPPVKHDAVEGIANGAGFGAALFLSEEGFALGERLAAYAEQVDLDTQPQFIERYIAAMRLSA